MEGVNRLESTQVDTSTMQQLSPLTDWRLSPILQNGKHPLDLSFGHTERWVYSIDNTPVGLLLISVTPSMQTASLEWLYVKEDFRSRGIATALLTEGVKTLKSLKIKALFAFYPKNDSFSPAIDALLLKFGWGTSTPFVQKYRFDIQGFNPGWLHQPFKLPEGYEIFLWKDLPSKERAVLEHRFDQYQIPAAVTPFRLESLIDPDCSVGIRRKGDGGVAAWSVCHWFDGDNIEFSSLYTASDPGIGVMALAESIKRLKQHPKGRTQAWMLIRVKDEGGLPSWKNFIRKRLAAEATEILEIYQGYLPLD